MSLNNIYQNESLCGHLLTSLPHKVWGFTKNDFCLYDRPDPGTLVIDRNYVIAKKIHYQKGNSTVYRTEFIFEKSVCDLIEFIGRRILGPCMTATSFSILSPIGFTAKLLHFYTRKISIYINSSLIAEKIRRVWNNADLFGHALTSTPINCYQFSTASLGWHLRADGTDRRTYTATYGRINSSLYELLKEQQMEYVLVPFELFEFIYRRIIGGALTLATGIVSPIGLIAKSVHLASQSASLNMKVPNCSEFP